MFCWQKAIDNLSHRLSRVSGYLPARRVGLGRQVRLIRGTVRPPYTCQVFPADHCNLTCRDCNHASPALAPRLVDLQRVAADFRRLAPFYRCRTITLLGGEPLLHPDLPGLIRGLREAGVSRHITLATNGTLLDRLGDGTLQLLNAIEISRYPGVGPDATALTDLRRRAAHFQVAVRIYNHERFGRMFAACGTADEALVGRVFRACRIANLCGCHSVHDGYLYKCPQSIYVPRLVAGGPPHDAREDGLPLGSGPGFYRDLVAYFASPQPLKACRYCAGTVGRDRPHALLAPAAWKADLQLPLEAIIDFGKLRAWEAGQDREVPRKPPVA